MAGILIAMRLRVLAHSLTGTRAAGLVAGGLAGLALAAGTILLAATGQAPAAVRTDLLALLLACWALGWIVGPLYTGGGDNGLRPEQFALLPIKPLRLAFGLLGAGFAGIGPVVSLIAFTSLVVYASDRGVAGVAVSVVAVALQVVLVLVLSRLVVGLTAVLTRSRLGAVLSAFVNASIATLLNQSWVLIWAAARTDLLRYGFPHGFSAVLHRLPSSWGMAAIDAAGAGNWGRVAAALGGLLAVIAVGLAGWARLLVRRTTTRPSQWAPRRSVLPDAGQGQTGLVAVKELRTWSRDLMRIHLFAYSLFFGVLYTTIPLIAGWRGMLPWTGAIVAGMAAATSSNLFGLDGTALWLNLVNPGGERAEIRGRQIAWLIQVAPITVLLTVAGTLYGGSAAIWPWTLAIAFALLGGGAGLIALLSVYALTPVLEPKKRTGNPLEAGPDFGQVFLALLLTLLTAAPAVAAAWAGTYFHQPALTWSAVAVGLATGATLTLWGGSQAARRLRDTGPEMLSTMRSGRKAKAGKPAADLSKNKSTLVTFLWVFCWIPLIPQGLIPLVMILKDSDSKVWFAALYLADPWRVPAATAFVLLGAAMLTAGIIIPARHARRRNA